MSSSGKRTSPQVKHCPRISLPSAITQAPPPPHNDLPLSINDIPSTTVVLKSAALPPPPCGAPLKKKHVPGKKTPFFDGVYGHPMFSLTPVNHFSAIPEGKSIIFNYYRKALLHEAAEGSSYILVDIYKNLWAVPKVFLKWRQAVDAGVLKEPEKSTLCFCLTHIGDEYQLYSSLHRDSLQVVKHPLPPPFSPLPKADELNDNDNDKEEEAFPADDNANESDLDFLQNKK